MATAAIIGTGFMGATHLENLRRLGIAIQGVLASSPDKGTRWAQAHGLPKAYATLDELLADPQVAAVHVTSPNRHHAAACRALLEAGKHVLCEKPLAVTATESAALVALAAQRPELIAAVNYNCRFYPLAQDLRARIATGELGRIVHCGGSYVQDWLLRPTDYNWRVLSSEGGPLRAVADIGTHWMDLVQWITGLPIEAVCADLHTVHAQRHRPRGEVQTFAREVADDLVPVAIDTEDVGNILLRFAGGARGVLWVSQVTAGRKNALRIEIAGLDGAAAFDGEEPNLLWLGHREQPNHLLTKDPSLMLDASRPTASYPGGHAEGYPDTFKQVFAAFYQAIEAGSLEGSTLATFADGHRELLLGEAILASHQQQGWMTIHES